MQNPQLLLETVMSWAGAELQLSFWLGMGEQFWEWRGQRIRVTGTRERKGALERGRTGAGFGE